ncbi:MAG TPA: FAD-linked oxidase C-terminal domain-containing protein [Actinomycetales bacterium]|nr:FAD-linked oxidase C-terminal domain-containing protein [Actinomycetales bacterium]
MSSPAPPLVELEARLSPGALVIDPAIVEGYRRDRADTAAAGEPVALVRAESVADVQETLRFATAHRVPVVPRGAGSGLAGGAAAIDGCLLLSLERMRSCEIDADALVAVVGPGLLNGELKRAAREHGLWYPPDPSSFEFCSLGGNLATNAGGLCCVKYGVTTDYVLGAEVVLADGTLLRLGGRTIKDVAGYDLKRLFVGSEGTLGVITKAVLRLKPVPPQATTLVATFADVESAGRAVTAAVRRWRPSTLELMDRATVQAVERYRPRGLDVDAGGTLVAQTDSGPFSGEADALEQVFRDEGATFVARTDDADEGEMFLQARREAFPALFECGTTLIEDVGVPVPRIAELVVGVERIADERATMIATVGHAGDGNFHPLICFDSGDPEAVKRADLAFGDVVALALSLGGTLTGEHGVGTVKQPYLADQLSPDVLAVSRRIKDALDPLGILNPGKVLAPRT